MSGGKPKTIISAVTSMYQPNNGIRSSDMPGARTFRIETVISIAAASAEISTNVTPNNHTSALIPACRAARKAACT